MKPSYILLDGNGNARLDDVGLVRFMESSREWSYHVSALERWLFLRSGIKIDLPLFGQTAVDAAVKMLGAGSVPQTIRPPANEVVSIKDNEGNP